MAIFGVTVEHEAAAVLFFSKVNKRLGVEDMVKNPFEGRILQVERGFYVVDMKPIYPNMSWVFALPGFLGLLILGHLVWWVLLSFSIWGLFGFFWSRFFFFLMLWVGLRKVGYRGRVRLLRGDETLRGVMNRWGR